MLKTPEKNKKWALKLCDEDDQSWKWNVDWWNRISLESWLLSKGLSLQIRWIIGKWNGKNIWFQRLSLDFSQKDEELKSDLDKN